METTNGSDDCMKPEQHAWVAGIDGSTAPERHAPDIDIGEERDEGDGERSDARGTTVSGAPQAARGTHGVQGAQAVRAHTYRAYLVRLWQDGAETPWRALTRDAETGEECRFATIEQLFVFLHRQTQSCNEPRPGAGRDTREHDRTRTDGRGGESPRHKGR